MNDDVNAGSEIRTRLIGHLKACDLIWVEARGRVYSGAVVYCGDDGGGDGYVVLRRGHANARLRFGEIAAVGLIRSFEPEGRGGE